MIEPETMELSLEQEFEMRKIEEGVKQMSAEQARSLLLQVSRILIVKDNIIREYMRRELGC